MVKMLAGLVLGMVAGAAVALLFAPSSGEELRTKLQERGKAVLEEAAEDSESEAAALA